MPFNHCLTVEFYDHWNVIPGKAIHLNCSSKCSSTATAGVRWWFRRTAGGDSNSSATIVNFDPNIVMTRENGLVILAVNRTQHVGTYECQTDEGVLLTRHNITLSGLYHHHHSVTLNKKHTNWWGSQSSVPAPLNFDPKP